MIQAVVWNYPATADIERSNDKMTYQDALTNLKNTYAVKYGFPEEEIKAMLDSGIKEYDLTVSACYNGLRMMLGEQLGEEEYFTTEEIAEMMQISKEEVLEEIENMKKHCEATGEDFSKYAIPVQESKVLYFPHGLKN